MFLLYLIAIILLIYGIINVVRKFALEDEYKREYPRDYRTEHPFVYQALPFASKALVIGIFIFIGTIVLDLFLIKVPGQQIAIKETPKGVSEKEMNPGWYISGPWNTFHYLDNTIWVWSTNLKGSEEADAMTIWSPTKGDSINTIGSKIGFDFSLNWKIDPAYGSWIYQNLGIQDEDGSYSWIEQNIVSKAASSAIIDATKDYTIFEANNNRNEIQAKALTQLRKELALNHLILLEAQIRGVHFDPDLERKIQLTQVNKQEAQNQKEVTKQIAELEIQAVKHKNIAVTEAQGKAEAIRLSATALENSPKLVEYEYVKALQISAGQGVKIVPDMILGSSSNMLYQLPGVKNK